MSRYIIFDSADGGELGTIEFDNEPEEMILETLAQAGYLDGPANEFEITDNYSFAEGALVIVDTTTNMPVLTLENEDEDDSDPLNGDDLENEA